MTFHDVIALIMLRGSKVNAANFCSWVTSFVAARISPTRTTTTTHTPTTVKPLPVVASKHNQTNHYTMSELYTWYSMKTMSRHLIYKYSWCPSNYHLLYQEALPHIHIPRLKPEIGRLRDKCVAYWRNRRKVGDGQACRQFLDHQWDVGTGQLGVERDVGRSLGRRYKLDGSLAVVSFSKVIHFSYSY